MSNKIDIDKINAKVHARPKPRKAKDLMDGDFALCLAYLEIEKMQSNVNYYFGGEVEFLTLEDVLDKIKEMLDVATLGDIDWEDVKKAPMRI
jgi:hypothetical protein